MKRKYVKPMMVLCLLATLVIAGTLAYLTDVTEELVNAFTVNDTVDIDLTENYDEFTLTPGTTQDKDPAVTVIGDASYVFVEVVETIPTAVLDDYSFSDYVEYEINTSGGSIYQWDDETGALEVGTTSWIWTLVYIDDASSTTDTGTYDDGGFYTTVTYVYALTDTSGALLSVSSLDKEGTDSTADAEYPILDGDEVTIPEDLTQAMLNLLVTDDTTDDATATYTVDLSFKGYAIQSAGVEGMTTFEIYAAAKAQ